MQKPADHWHRYYHAVAGRPPRPTLLQALAAFEAEGRAPGLAIDLGAGTGRDSRELLRRGWPVLAIDGEAAALEILAREAGRPDLLETRAVRFEALTALPRCRLVNASFSLPFCPPAAFPGLWRILAEALEPGGRFCGHLLGPEDDSARDPTVTSVAEAALAPLLRGYVVELQETERRRGTTAKGRPKAWHLHHLVLRREEAGQPLVYDPPTAV